jgi:hypothetical protein
MGLKEYSTKMDVLFKQAGIKFNWEELLQKQEELSRLSQKDQYDYILGLAQVDK